MGWWPWAVYLKWREPRCVRRHFDRLDKRSYRATAKVYVFMVIFFMLNWWIADLNPQKNPPPFSKALAAAIGGTIVLVLFLDMADRYWPSTIKIQKDWIRRIRGSGLKDCKYKDIESYSIDWKIIEGRDFPVLSITPMKGKPFAIGIAASVALDELEKILSERIKQTKCENTEDSSARVNPNI